MVRCVVAAGDLQPCSWFPLGTSWPSGTVRARHALRPPRQAEVQMDLAGLHGLGHGGRLAVLQGPGLHRHVYNGARRRLGLVHIVLDLLNDGLPAEGPELGPAELHSLPLLLHNQHGVVIQIRRKGQCADVFICHN